MILRERSFPHALGSVALLILTLTSASAQNAPVQTGTVHCQGIDVISDELASSDAEEYCRYAVDERKKVDKYWGATWQDPIRIYVSSGFAIARSLVTNGGAPGKIEMPLARVRDKTGPLLHEIVHNYAPNQNRFLQEGLGVYLQDRMGGNPGFPNFGQHLHSLARRSLSSVSSLERLNEVRFPQPLSTVIPERAAYLLAGSFVRFLIERYRLPQFRALYDSGDYEKAYRKSLQALENEWRSNLGKY